MIEIITNVNSAINNVVWGWPALILLGFVGILMTCLTKFFYIWSDQMKMKRGSL